MTFKLFKIQYLFFQWILEDVYLVILTNFFYYLVGTTNYKFDVIILSETWVYYKCELSIDDYVGFHCPGILNKADGKCLYIKGSVSDINYNVINTCCSNEAVLCVCETSFYSILAITLIISYLR